MYQPNGVTTNTAPVEEVVTETTDVTNNETVVDPVEINSNEISIIEKLFDETHDLDTKLTKIIEFIEQNNKFNELSDEARILLVEQRNIMSKYLDILQKRISLFSIENHIVGTIGQNTEPAIPVGTAELQANPNYDTTLETPVGVPVDTE